MKKVLFSILALCGGCSMFAQERMAPGAVRPAPSTERVHSVFLNKRSNDLSAARTTTINTADTLYLYNNYDSLLFDSAALYGYGLVTPADSGYVFGINAYGDNGFAEYFYPGYQSDTSVDIIGVYSSWGGTVNPNSTNTITFNLWAIDTTVYQITNTIYLAGLPGTVFASSQAVPFKSLSLTPGTATLTYFTTPVPNIMTDFFLGYTVASYSFSTTNGDTIGLRSTPDGTGFGPGYYQTDGQGDTLYYSQNAVHTTSGSWLDGYVDIGKDVNLSLLPIYFIDPNTSVKGVTKSNLTVFGCAPNPAVNNTNIRLSVQQNTDVTIQVVDAMGRTMTTIQQSGLTAGQHTINVDTEGWPAGNYVYVAHTSDGSAIASQLTVVR